MPHKQRFGYQRGVVKLRATLKCEVNSTYQSQILPPLACKRLWIETERKGGGGNFESFIAF